MTGVAPEIATEDVATEIEISKPETAKIFFIAPSPEFSMTTRFQARRRMLPCLLTSISQPLPESRRQGCLRSQEGACVGFRVAHNTPGCIGSRFARGVIYVNSIGASFPRAVFK